MAYNYYCTHCGRPLDQDKVYFDMQPVLTGTTEEPFKILKFWITKKELEAMIASGTKQDMGYTRCTLTLHSLMKFISNENNLNDAEIAGLSLEDINNYITDISLDADEAETNNDDDDLFGFSESADEVKEGAATNKEETPVAAAILAIERKDDKNEDRYFTRENLKKDLSVLYTVFSNEAEYSFDIKLDTEPDNEGRPVLTGYQVNAGMPRHITTCPGRICRYCGDSVFAHAGTAEHRSIAFIGDQAAGKTSTILALAHYAENAMRGALNDDPIWKESQGIGSIAYIELISPSKRLSYDMYHNFANGIAPAKTEAGNRTDAYSATFRIKNKYQSKYYLLTLTDLPGELCIPMNDQEELDTDNIKNNFPVALACDAFVLCFDSRTAVKGNANRMVDKTCRWANAFQKLREEYSTSIGKDAGLHAMIPKDKVATGLYAPIMLAFTKCPDLEEPEQVVQKEKPRNAFDLVARTYVFDNERSIIDQNQVYRSVGDQIEEYAFLKNAYHARLRCSPYGFAAPNEIQVKANPSLLLDENGKRRFPAPKHIDVLMRWLLEVSGCIPVDAVYHPSPDPMSKTVYDPKPNFIKHTQYRALAPRGKGKDADIHEALARCYLFENPGQFDKQFLMHYDQKAILTTHRLKSKFQRN